MEIKILGTGCAKCKDMYERVKKAVEETQCAAAVTKVEDIMEITAYGVMTTPALVINGKVISCGKLLKTQEVVKLLQTHTQGKE